jgi:hypothetical protein
MIQQQKMIMNEKKIVERKEKLEQFTVHLNNISTSSY